MDKYSSYKHSDVFWYNEIPTEWSISKNKFVLNEQKNIVDESWKDYKLLSLTKKGVIERDIENSKGKFPEFFNTYKIIKKNDLIFCLYDIQETPRTIGISENDGMITGSYNVFQTNQNPKFIYYWFLIIDDVKGLKPFYTGMRNVVRNETFMSLKIFLPPIQEQEQIVNYLDEKTTIIDKLISTKQRKVELLKEQRNTLINQVITKGLNPNVKMKDSGVEWIGEIPESWNTTKLKHTCEIIYGISPPETTYNDKGLGVELVNGPVEYSKTDFGYTRSLKWTTEPKKFCKKGSLLFCLRGSTTGRMNITHKDLSIGRGVCSINSKGSQWYLIYSMFILRIYIQKQISGSTFPSVVKEDVDNFTICNPPINEQKEIVEYLDKHTKEIDDLVSLEQNKIELLKEYRQSLISEVITGKIKVV
jgi:type I restriction enzyme S subunit